MPTNTAATGLAVWWVTNCAVGWVVEVFPGRTVTDLTFQNQQALAKLVER